MTQEIEPRHYIDAIIRRWPILFLMGLLGGLVGYGLSFRYPAIYEAVAVMAVGLDFDRDPPIKQREQDYAESKVVAFANSDEILLKTLDALGQNFAYEEPLPTLKELKQITSIHRIFSLWQLKVSHTNPALAAELCNTWAYVAYESLWEAHSHAVRANSLEAQLELVLIQLSFSNKSLNSDSQIPEEIKALEKEALELERQIEQEIQRSQSVVSFMSFELTNEASIPTKPVARAMSHMILAGSFIGLILGILTGITWEAVLDKKGNDQ